MTTVLKDTSLKDTSPEFVIPYGPREVVPDVMEEEGNFCNKSALEKYSGWFCAAVVIAAALYFGVHILWFLLKK